MNLAALLADAAVRELCVRVVGDVERPVGKVTRDSREVGPSDLFVAIEGARVDGHDLVDGLRAAAVVVQREVAAAPGVAQVQVSDTKLALALLAAARQRHPSRDVPVVGITGTNGKTTMCTVVDEALLALGVRSARIGTAGNVFAGVAEPAGFTTPEAPELQSLLRGWVDRGTEAVVMEVSSIGLAQRRVDGTRYHTAVFTNLTQDHLDFHGTLEAYGEAKSRLFRKLLRPEGGMPRAVLCADDPAHSRMGAPADAWTYGFSAAADVRIEDLELAAGGMRFTLQAPFGRLDMVSRLVGRHNAQNLAGAAAVLATLGHDADAIATGLCAVRGAAGRLERIEDPAGRLLLVDYAHSPDALQHALATVREIVSGRVVVVFGCGGDRDAGKRPLMGEVAERLADVVVVTNDNPRSEDPQAIADAIAGGLAHPERAHVELDRGKAIRLALRLAARGDAVLVAGKGHETYQEQGGQRRPFDDRAELRTALGEEA